MRATLILTRALIIFNLIARLPGAVISDDPEAPFSKIQFINPRAPYYTPPAVKGFFYEAEVPATLDLADMARMAIEGVLTRQTDPDFGYETYQQANFPAPPEKPVMYHSFHDFNGSQPKYLEALTLLRTICGSTESLNVDKGLLNGLLRQIGPDGLVYVPVKGRPWATFDDWNSVLREPNLPPADVEHIYNLWPNGRSMLTMATCLMRDPENTQLREAMGQMIHGIREISVEKDDLLWFPFQLIYRTPHTILGAGGAYGGKASAPEPFLDGLNASRNRAVPEDPGAYTDAGPVLGGLTRYYRLTGDPLAKDLAGKLAHYIAREFREDGSFKWGHTHANCFALINLADYADAVGDERLKQIALKGYLFARQNGVPEVGYFPEGVNLTMVGFKPADENPPKYERQRNATSESCATADMVQLAIKLSEYGIADCWDDVDCYVRNHFAESQLRRVDWISRIQMPEAQKKLEIVGFRKPEEYQALLQFPTFLVNRDVPERIRGAFATTCSINDWNPPQVRPGGMGVSSCCTANGSRAIFYAWRAILSEQNQVTRIHLLLNRASHTVDIDSHIPYAGQVDFHVKQPVGLEIRLPDYLDASKLSVTANGNPVSFSHKDHYLVLGAQSAGTIVTLRFPMEERTLKVKIPFGEIEEATLIVKGHDVVEIQPQGLNYPYYQRDYYRDGKTLWKRLLRFQPEEQYPRI